MFGMMMRASKMCKLSAIALHVPKADSHICKTSKCCEIDIERILA